MYSAPLFFFTGAAFAASNAAGIHASNTMLGVPVASGDMQQHGVMTLGKGIRGVHNYGKASGLPRMAFVLVSLAATLALIFLTLQCFRALSSRSKGAYSGARRLATGGEDEEHGKEGPCQVSHEVAGQVRSSGYSCPIGFRGVQHYLVYMCTGA